MTSEEILDGNKLIAEFDGLKIITDDISFFDTNYKPLKKYNELWACIMPIVEKIESISELSQNRKCNFHVTIEKHRCFIKWGIGYTICDINDYHNSKISIVYKAIIEFIKWYNQNKKI